MKMSQQYLNKELLEQLQADFPAIVEIFGESAPYQIIVNPKNILEVLDKYHLIIVFIKIMVQKYT